MPEVGVGDVVAVWDNDGAARKSKKRQALVVAVHPSFYLLDYGRYRATLSRAKLLCGEARLELVRRAG